MARDNRRMKYGRCINEECEMCSKDVKHPIVQEISGRKEFVCAKCGHELRECLPPSSWWDSNKKWCVPLAVVAVLGIGGGAYWGLGSGSESDTTEEVPIDTVTTPVDTEAVAPVEEKTVETPKETTPVKAKKSTTSAPKEAAPSKASASYGTVSISGGTYTGDLKNGVPHGHGTITYKKSTTIGSSQYVANPGDTFEGEFRDGRICGGLGYWVHDGNTEAIKL